jgi:hypothetical protein
MTELSHGAVAVHDSLKHGHDSAHAEMVTLGDFLDPLRPLSCKLHDFTRKLRGNKPCSACFHDKSMK